MTFYVVTPNQSVTQVHSINLGATSTNNEIGLSQLTTPTALVGSYTVGLFVSAGTLSASQSLGTITVSGNGNSDIQTVPSALYPAGTQYSFNIGIDNSGFLNP